MRKTPEIEKCFTRVDVKRMPSQVSTIKLHVFRYATIDTRIPSRQVLFRI